MELYVLDEQLRRVEIIDMFESLIWTERYSDIGDFQLNIVSTKYTRNVLTEGVMLALSESFRVMVIGSVEKSTDSDGRSMLEITGSSLEGVMQDRVAKDSMNDLTDDSAWDITDTPAGICRFIFKEICIDGTLSPDDIIPYIHEGNFIITPGSWLTVDPELEWVDATGVWADAFIGVSAEDESDMMDIISVNLEPDSVFKHVKDLCDAYELGFRLLRNYDKSELYFDVYSGIDRSTMQTIVDSVQFSLDLDNLMSSTEFDALTGSKNVAYVFSPNGAEVVFGNGAAEDVSGFERRVIYVDASDIELPAGLELSTLLQQRGLVALGQAKPVSAFDGEISKLSTYKYGHDFNLGDLVSLQKSDGTVSKMRVTEQIFVSDLEGERSYPTLSLSAVIDPTTWYGQPRNLEWAEVDDEIVWAEY